MRFDCLSKDEIQRLRLSYSVQDMALLFEMEVSEIYTLMREIGVHAPTVYVIDLPRKELAYEIASLGVKKIAKKYNVSTSFLRSLFKKEESEDVEFLNSQVERFGSTSIVKKMYNYTGKLNPPTSKKRFVGLGSMKSSIGRKAEEFVMDWLSFCKDMNEEDPRSLYDLEHPKFGRINVKAKNGTISWRFNEVENCDFVAAVCLQKNEIQFACLIPVKDLPITINRNNYQEYLNFSLNRRFCL